MSEENKIVLGKIGAVYGIKGWLKVHSFTDETESILDYFPWSLRLGDKIKSVEISDWKKHRDVFLEVICEEKRVGIKINRIDKLDTINKMHNI